MTRRQHFHIRQRDSFDCAIATIAAVANLPYESVAKLSPRLPGPEGLRAYEVWVLLQAATRTKWRYPRVIYFRRLQALAKSPDGLMLFIRPPRTSLLQWFKKEMQHCIFARDGRIFDPECHDAVPADQFARINWIPTTAFYPVDARKLKEIQESNRNRYHKSVLWSEIIAG